MGNKVQFYSDIMSLNNAVTGSCKPIVVRLPGYQAQAIRFAVDCGSFQVVCSGYEDINLLFTGDLV